MKTANVVVGPGDVPKIVDFGIALRGGNDTRLTQTGMYSGTVGFTAPEVYRASSPTRGRTCSRSASSSTRC
jgi:serine/threonine protein kinase